MEIFNGVVTLINQNMASWNNFKESTVGGAIISNGAL